MINGNYFRNKGLLVSWSLFREPKEKAESQGMLSPGRTCYIRRGKSWIRKRCWVCILKCIIIISCGLIWRAFPDGSGDWLSLTPATRWSAFHGFCQGRCALPGRAAWDKAACPLSAGEQAVFKGWDTPFPAVLSWLTQSNAVFLLWFAALNWIWSLYSPCLC